MGTRRRIQRSTRGDLISIGEAFNEFFREKETKNLTLATLQNYKQSVDIFMRFCDYQEEAPVNKITSDDLLDWVGSLRENDVRPASINHYLRDIRAFLYWCMERQYLSRFTIQLIEAQEEMPKIFSDEDLTALLVKPRKSDSFTEWRTWAIVNWVLGTGNRASTICNVRLGDLNFNYHQILLTHTKNKKAQLLPLSPTLEAVLKEYIRMWRKDAPKEGYLFPNVGEEQLTTNALRQAFERYNHKRGVEQTNIHGLRHNFARGWVQNNGNMFTLQQILGHSDLTMTRHYVQLFSCDLARDFEKFAPLDTMKRSKRTQLVKRSESP